MERDLHAGHHPEAAATAAERPEEVRVRLVVRANDVAVGGDDLGGNDARGRKAVLAGQPADPAAERVADHADVCGRAMESGEPVLGGGVDHVAPDRSGSDPRHACVRVELDTGHPRRVDQERTVEGGAPRPVAGALHGDA